ncbi:MAG TPA: cupin domain-containing protein [Mycobacterium sp.]|nr:cupin domain-containing protein [Mycobacterium sp.]
MTGRLHFQSSADHLPPPDATERQIASKMVYSSPEVKVVNLAFAEGALLADHSSQHPILVQVLSGDVEFTCAGETTRIGAGGLMSVDGGAVHAVRAIAPTSLTVTFLL